MFTTPNIVPSSIPHGVFDDGLIRCLTISAGHCPRGAKPFVSLLPAITSQIGYFRIRYFDGPRNASFAREGKRGGSRRREGRAPQIFGCPRGGRSRKPPVDGRREPFDRRERKFVKLMNASPDAT